MGRYCLAIAFMFAAAFPIQAQDAQIFLELEMAPSLTRSQSIDVTSFMRGDDQRGPSMYRVFIQNEANNTPAKNLYLQRLWKSEKRGILSETYQEQSTPFELRPRQRILAGSKNLEKRLSQGRNQVNFEGGMTTAGEELMNDMGGTGQLPPDTYSLTINIYQGNNSQNGGVLVASAEQEFGGNLVANDQGFYLLSPGDVVGSGMEIFNAYPEFRWEGSNGVAYRLIVVKAGGRESPESLIQGARSSEPLRGRGVSGQGSLLDFEVADVTVRQPSYQLPSSGVQSLEPGGTYYWQVFAEIRGSRGSRETRSSEIWSFTLSSDASVLSSAQTRELERLLRRLSRDGQIPQLLRDGYGLWSVEIDGQTYSGTAALEKLTELVERANDGEISIVNK